MLLFDSVLLRVAFSLAVLDSTNKNEQPNIDVDVDPLLKEARRCKALEVLEDMLEERIQAGIETDVIEAMMLDLDGFVRDNTEELDRILKGEANDNAGTTDMEVDKVSKKRSLTDRDAAEVENQDGTTQMDQGVMGPVDDDDGF